jgi:hypothetical protein
MCGRLRAAAALLIGLLILTACGDGPGHDGLPQRPDAAGGGGPAPLGHIAWQPPLLPITFSLDANGTVAVTVNPLRLATLIGTVTVGVGVVKNLANDQPLPAQPADVTQLIICPKNSVMQRCQVYQIGTGRKIHIEMNENFVQDVERNRITIEAAPDSIIKLTDNGPPTKLEAFGPAHVDVEELHFNENSKDTYVDLERSRSGTTTDLSYDHMTAELKPINGAKISKYATHSSWGAPSSRSDYPSEQECSQKSREDYANAFNKDDLKATYSIFCIKTAEGDLGFLFIEPNFDDKPISYYVYSYTWVR